MSVASKPFGGVRTVDLIHAVAWVALRDRKATLTALEGHPEWEQLTVGVFVEAFGSYLKKTKGVQTPRPYRALVAALRDGGVRAFTLTERELSVDDWHDEDIDPLSNAAHARVRVWSDAEEFGWYFPEIVFDVDSLLAHFPVNRTKSKDVGLNAECVKPEVLREAFGQLATGHENNKSQIAEAIGRVVRTRGFAGNAASIRQAIMDLTPADLRKIAAAPDASPPTETSL